mgnify:CR=1 FL=1
MAQARPGLEPVVAILGTTGVITPQRVIIIGEGDERIANDEREHGNLDSQCTCAGARATAPCGKSRLGVPASWAWLSMRNTPCVATSSPGLRPARTT